MSSTTETQTETHICDCAVCGGFTFTAPRGYITGRAVATQVHNYAQMLRNPMMRRVMESRGLKAADEPCRESAHSHCETHDATWTPFADACDGA